MKKLYQSFQQKRRRLKAQIRELNKTKPKKDRVRSPLRKMGRVKAPENFSFINRTDDAQRFLIRLSNTAIMCNGYLYIDLSDIKRLTVDALLLMIERINKRNEFRGLKIYCSYPKDQEIADIVLHSGFSDFIADDNKKNTNSNYNTFKEFSGYEREYDFILECHKQTSMHVKGIEDCDTVELNSLLVEFMDNTKKHASPSSKKNFKWWFSIYHIKGERKTCFTFFDRGIGILKSANVNTLKNNLKSLITDKSLDDLVVDMILAGSLKSRTEEKERGKGLWQILQCVDLKEFSKFDLITNQKHIKFKEKTSTDIMKSFDGTLYYWEFEENE